MSDKPGPLSSPSPARSLPSGWAGGAPDADAFYQMAEAALAALPAPFHPHIKGLLITIEDVADEATLDALEIDHPYELTGLYEGRPLTERSIDVSGAMPDRVTLYRVPILVEWIEGGERLDWLIHHVLIHEIGHHFGFSDDDIHALEDMA
ncbi:metallopeptidase family protein [Sphingopyxis sp. MWB1]|uniref:metallopeptidase family protein n=1 Tax=Sphingopyxis sp. MWB1 TaxID=1537715 RepID=UPI00068BD864|nr:metallopeptidase family protein [Sphingopyxis sp. MWB1]